MTKDFKDIIEDEFDCLISDVDYVIKTEGRLQNIINCMNKALNIDGVVSRRELLMSYAKFECTPDYWAEDGKARATKQIGIYLEAH